MVLSNLTVQHAGGSGGDVRGAGRIGNSGATGSGENPQPARRPTEPVKVERPEGERGRRRNCKWLIDGAKVPVPDW